jgi:hypothetical protein
VWYNACLVIGPFFCAENTITAKIGLDMLQVFVFRKIVALNKKDRLKSFFSEMVLNPLQSCGKKYPEHRIS